MFFGLRRVAASSLIGLHHRVLVSVATPVLRSSHLILSSQRSSVQLSHLGLRVFLFMHALLILLIIEVALPDLSAIVLLRGI